MSTKDAGVRLEMQQRVLGSLAGLVACRHRAIECLGQILLVVLTAFGRSGVGALPIIPVAWCAGERCRAS